MAGRYAHLSMMITISRVMTGPYPVITRYGGG